MVVNIYQGVVVNDGFCYKENKAKFLIYRNLQDRHARIIESITKEHALPDRTGPDRTFQETEVPVHQYVGELLVPMSSWCDDPTEMTAT